MREVEGAAERKVAQLSKELDRQQQQVASKQMDLDSKGQHVNELVEERVRRVCGWAERQIKNKKKKRQTKTHKSDIMLNDFSNFEMSACFCISFAHGFHIQDRLEVSLNKLRTELSAKNSEMSTTVSSMESTYEEKLKATRDDLGRVMSRNKQIEAEKVDALQRMRMQNERKVVQLAQELKTAQDTLSELKAEHQVDDPSVNT